VRKQTCLPCNTKRKESIRPLWRCRCSQIYWFFCSWTKDWRKQDVVQARQEKIHTLCHNLWWLRTADSSRRQVLPEMCIQTWSLRNLRKKDPWYVSIQDVCQIVHLTTSLWLCSWECVRVYYWFPTLFCFLYQGLQAKDGYLIPASYPIPTISACMSIVLVGISNALTESETQMLDGLVGHGYFDQYFV